MDYPFCRHHELCSGWNWCWKIGIGPNFLVLSVHPPTFGPFSTWFTISYFSKSPSANSTCNPSVFQVLISCRALGCPRGRVPSLALQPVSTCPGSRSLPVKCLGFFQPTFSVACCEMPNRSRCLGDTGWSFRCAAPVWFSVICSVTRSLDSNLNYHWSISWAPDSSLSCPSKSTVLWS